MAQIEEVTGDCIPVTDSVKNCTLEAESEKTEVSIGNILAEYREKLEESLER